MVFAAPLPAGISIQMPIPSRSGIGAENHLKDRILLFLVLWLFPVSVCPPGSAVFSVQRFSCHKCRSADIPQPAMETQRIYISLSISPRFFHGSYCGRTYDKYCMHPYVSPCGCRSCGYVQTGCPMNQIWGRYPDRTGRDPMVPRTSLLLCPK